jgi:uncharacterized membrane protein (UPF0127 family)
MRRATRRGFLSSIGVAGLAGCLGASDDSGGSVDDPTGTSDGATATRTGTPTATASTATPNQRADTETPVPTATETRTETPTQTRTETTPTPTQTQTALFPGYEKTELRVVTGEGDTLGSVTAAIAETSEEWTTGLSETESLPEDWGMLFVDETAKDRSFWMKDMEFGLDIIFIDEEKRITEILHAEAPGPDEDGTETLYTGYAQYILEVNYDWTTRHDVLVSDIVEFSL